MKIRPATLADVPAFVALGQRFHGATRFKHYDYNPQRVAATLTALLEDTRGVYCFLVAEETGGQPIGGLVGTLEQHFFSEQLVASVIHYDVLAEKRMGGAGLRLLTAFRKWAENRGAHELNAGVNSGVDMDKMDRFLRKLGFRLTGGNYSLTLNAAAPQTAAAPEATDATKNTPRHADV